MSTLSKFCSSVGDAVAELRAAIDSATGDSAMFRMPPPSTWLVGGATFLATYWIYTRLVRDRHLPPGPVRLPLLGNVVELMWQPDPGYIYLSKLRAKYGSLMTIYAGPYPSVVINSMQGMRDTLIAHQNEFAGRIQTMTMEIFTEGCKDIGIADVGPAWSLHRKVAMTALKQFAAQDTLTQLVHESTTEVCELMANRKEPFEPRETIYLIVYNMLAGLCFGKHYKFDDEDFQWLMKIIKETYEDFATGFLGDYLPFLAFLPTPGKRKAQKVTNDIVGYMDKFIVEHVNSYDESNIRDITDAIIQAQKHFEREGVEDMSLFTEVHRRQTIMDIFFAGTDTTAFTIYWLMVCMMTYPALQEEVHAEIDRELGRSKVISYKDRLKLPRTDAIIHEVMRYRPIAPLSMPHKVMKTVYVNGYKIPKGTMVLPNLYACHFDPACWSEPEKFDPSRFLTADGSKVVSKPDGFVPFSVGRRQCAGEHVARVDIFLVFTNLMQKLKFLPDPARKEPYNMDINIKAGAFICEPLAYKILAQMR